MRILVLNGPNLNLLGSREPHIYGSTTLDEIVLACNSVAQRAGAELEFRQSNHEGQLIDWLQEARQQFQGVILNPGGLAHSSVALLDAVVASGLPVVEVHVTNLARREVFRQNSFIAVGCAGRVEGFGADGYRLALLGMVQLLQQGER